MAINDSIKGGRNDSMFPPVDYQQERVLLVKLQNLSDMMKKDTADYANLLAQQEFEKKKKLAQQYEQYLTAFIDKRHKLEASYNKKIEKAKADGDKKAQKKFEDTLKNRLQQEKKNFNDLLKYQEKKEQQAEKARIRAIGEQMVADRKEAGDKLFDGKIDLRARFRALRDLNDAQGAGAVADAILGSLGDLTRKLDDQINTIASYQSRLDTRLQGSGKRWEGGFMGFGGGLAQTITGIVAISPLVRQQKVTENLANLVDKGIAYNVEQRAFLQTISEKIATTFDAANGTLLQLIRVQQADTTAARLGAENALTTFLNSMYQTTEYLSDMSNTVKQNIYEAVAQVGGAGGVGLEYQIQKWLGSLYSVGMSSQAIQNISSALGMLGSGNVAGLASNSAMQNLLVMATTQNQGLDYADLLTNGINESNVNILMESMVKYLASIANSNKVVQSQYASVFGMSMSDILAAQNLISSVGDITRNSLNYNDAINTLMDAANSMYERTSTGELMQTAFDNIKYSMSAGIAANPVLYGIWKASNMLTDLVGGIAIPAISVFGNMVDLHTTVADLMRVGALSGGIFSSIGTMVGAAMQGSGFGFSGEGMLSAMGIKRNTLSTITRGTGQYKPQSGASVSQSSTTIGNTSASDIYDSSMASANEQKEAAMAEAKGDEPQIELKDINSNVVKIYEMFRDIISGGALTVRMSAPTGIALTNLDYSGI